MTEMGVIHMFSAIYLSGAICLVVSLNESRDPRRIIRDTLRRWMKFSGIALVIGVVVAIIG